MDSAGERLVGVLFVPLMRVPFMVALHVISSSGRTGEKLAFLSPPSCFFSLFLGFVGLVTRSAVI